MSCFFFIYFFILGLLIGKFVGVFLSLMMVAIHYCYVNEHERDIIFYIFMFVVRKIKNAI